MLKRLLALALILFCARCAFADARLPGNTAPLHYTLTIFPDLKTLTFKGEENVSFTVLKPTRSVVVNSLNLVVTRGELSSPLLPGAENGAIKTDNKAETTTFTFPAPLKKGTYNIEIAWNGKIGIDPDGLFYVKYQSGKTQKIMLSTQFESVDARRMFPCWDEPAYKATFQLAAEVPQDFLAVNNMPAESKKTLPDGDSLVRFYPTPKMSSYLVVFTEGDLKFVSGQSDGVKIRVIAPAGEEQNGAFALGWAEKVLHYYDWYYGIKYPLPKLDLIAIPGGFGGAMENWGGITFNESILLFDPNKSSQETKESIAIVVAHEMAHQWTGDLVTMKWWDDIWLNEGFAEWMMNKVTNHLYPSWHVLLRVNQANNEAMETDALSTTTPIERPVPTGRAADTAFDDITYEKGAAVIRMLQSYLGENTFRKGIDLYMRRYKYSNATSGDLWKALSDVSHQPVGRIAAGWIRQPGFPLVKVAATCAKGKEILSFTQEPFTLLQSHPKAYRWAIPVDAATLGGKSHAHFLLTGNKIIALGKDQCNLPVVFNDQGYYRIEYTPALFKQVEASLDKLTPAQQSHLLYDAWALAQKGDYSVSSYLDLVQPLSKKADLATWSQILDAFQVLDELEIGLTGREQFHAYARQILAPLMARLGWETKPMEGENTTILRTRVIQALGIAGDKAVIAEAFKRFNAFLQSPDSLPSNLRPAVFHIVGRYADQKTYDELHALGMKAQTTEEKDLFYQSLASAQDPKLAEEALNISLGNELDPVTGVYGILVVAYGGEHPNLAWKFFQSHVKAISARMPAMQMGFFLQGLVASFHGDKTANEVAAYASKHLPQVFEPLIARGLQTNKLSAFLKSHMVPQVDTWVAKFLGQKAAVN